MFPSKIWTFSFLSFSRTRPVRSAGWNLHVQPGQADERRVPGSHEGGGLGLPLLPRRGPDPRGQPQPVHLRRQPQARRRRHGQVRLQVRLTTRGGVCSASTGPQRTDPSVSVLSRLPYKMYFGGVSALSPLHYLKMNGFPNNYWGWGGEDDDIGIRWDLFRGSDPN